MAYLRVGLEGISIALLFQSLDPDLQEWIATWVRLIKGNFLLVRC